MILKDGRVAETILDSTRTQTRLCVGRGQKWMVAGSIKTGNHVLVPYPAFNNMIHHRVLLLPGEPVEYGTTADLISEIQAYIHRYVDLTPQFEDIATHYVLLSWVYDSFFELPYLRFKGDYGTGKTRALLTVGSICYKPLFASGASTVSPLFRMLDSIQGTLIVDEADFRFSDEKSEIIKILNNGNARGFPILRSEPNKQGEFNPRAFLVYGPKIIATRKVFEDQALESRCITEELGTRPLRKDIPISRTGSLEEEARELRSKLLLYRLRTRSAEINASDLSELDPRIRQVFGPLYSLMESERAKESLLSYLSRHQSRLDGDRRSSVAAQVLTIIKDLLPDSGGRVSISDITDSFAYRFGADYGEAITPRWIGHVIRHELSLLTHKSSGRFVISQGELPKLKWLFQKFGIVEMNAHGEKDTQKDVPDVPNIPLS